MPTRKGKVFIELGDWKVESCSFAYFVKDGRNGDIHPVLHRGRDENKWVEFELDRYNEAIMIELV